MNLLSRVVWSEGMYLGPHHFQAQTRYYEDSLHFSSAALNFKPWGFLGLSLDHDALKNGVVSLLHSRGLFADGLPFQMPECDRLPDPRQIADLFGSGRDALDCFLAVPSRLTAAIDDRAEPRSRLTTVKKTFNDEITGRHEREISVGRKNISILFEGESKAGFETLHLCRILRDAAGIFVFDADFIPPCIQISASESLMLALSHLLEILSAKISALNGNGRETNREFVPRELANFWLLHAIGSGFASLNHLWTSKRSHPEELFVELSRLAGALCTFTLNTHPRELPLYQHESLESCFAPLFVHIRKNLDVVVPVNCVPIPLEKTAGFFWAGIVPDSRYLTRSRWILGVQSDLGEADLISKAPSLVKVCSSKFVSELVKRAMAGLTLTHVPQPPSSVPIKVEAQYFSISKTGPFWDHIVQSMGVGVYVPGEIPQPRLELFAVMDS